MSALAETEVRHGWGGPIAIALAFLLILMVHAIRVMIQNHSPTADQDDEWDDLDQEKEWPEDDWADGGGVDDDHDGVRRYDWGSTSKD